MFAPPICRRKWRNNAFSVPPARTKTAAIQRTSPASEASNQTSAIRAERSEAIKPRIARRRAEEEGADTLFVCE
jgi:hypothetical protein